MNRKGPKASKRAEARTQRQGQTRRSPIGDEDQGQKPEVKRGLSEEHVGRAKKKTGKQTKSGEKPVNETKPHHGKLGRGHESPERLVTLSLSLIEGALGGPG